MTQEEGETSGLNNVRYHLAPDREDEPGYSTPNKPSEWEGLTDEELFLLARKVGRSWHMEAQLSRELNLRLIRALKSAAATSTTAASRLAWMTFALIVLTLVVAGFTIALFFHD